MIDKQIDKTELEKMVRKSEGIPNLLRNPITRLGKVSWET